MVTMKKMLLICGMFFLIGKLFCQDTIQIDSIHIYSIGDLPQNKLFYSKIEYGREIVHFNETQKKLQYCYIYDNNKNCRGYDYQFINDSVLKVDAPYGYQGVETWSFKKNDELKYNVVKKGANTITTGIASSMLPFQKEGVFVVTDYDGDTLWLEDYTTYNYKHPRSLPEFTFHISSCPEEFYIYSELDSYPKMSSGDSLNRVQVERFIPYCCNDYRGRESNFSCFITKEGKVKNVLFDTEFTDEKRSLLKTLKSMEPLIPAVKDGQKVDCHWVMVVYSSDRLISWYSTEEYREWYYKLNKKQFKKKNRLSKKALNVYR